MPPSGLLLQPGTTLELLQRQSPLQQLETRILLAHGLQLSRVQLITQSERRLNQAEAELLSQLFCRRLAGEPIAYLVGEREFFGLVFKVSPDVLIPRPETELLVELGTARLPKNGKALDMGTGSGAIAVALAHARPDAHMTALDASASALLIAQENAARHNTSIRFVHSDWYTALQDEAFDLILSNPPYIAAGDPHLAQGDLRFEPAAALTDDADGLGALRIIISGAHHHLRHGGWLLLEHGYDQSGCVQSLLLERGFEDVQSWNDLAGIPRITGGRLA